MEFQVHEAPPTAACAPRNTKPHLALAFSELCAGRCVSVESEGPNGLNWKGHGTTTDEKRFYNALMARVRTAKLDQRLRTNTSNGRRYIWLEQR